MSRTPYEKMLFVMAELVDQMNTVHARDLDFIDRSRLRLQRQSAALHQIGQTQAAFNPMAYSGGN